MNENTNAPLVLSQSTLEGLAHVTGGVYEIGTVAPLENFMFHYSLSHKPQKKIFYRSFGVCGRILYEKRTVNTVMD